ncbi:MAG: hypothetical protein J0H18_17625 [Rhizobiales bacterium]|nr:hypothetical protein [Hyphomicrobiales bacterium]OJY06683.1 MAG: hypothetical protein BGP07_16715 [Rhizobiales bacterium 63-22]
MAVATQGARIQQAIALMNLTLFLAVGTGDPAWDSQPAPSTPEDQTAQDAAWSQLTDLTAKIGVTRVRDKSYVTPDDAGTILVGDGSRYSLSTDPTGYVYLCFQLDLSDASDTTLREAGIFVGTQLAASVPEGQMYIADADVADFGRLIEIDRFSPIVRDGSLSQSFSFILTM